MTREGEELMRPLPRVYPLIKLELRDKNEPVALHERKPMMFNFKAIDRSIDGLRGQAKPGPPDATIFGVFLSRRE